MQMIRKIIILILASGLIYVAATAALAYSSYLQIKKDAAGFSSLNVAQYEEMFRDLMTLHSRLKLIRPLLFLYPQYEKKYEQIDKIVTAKPILDQLLASNGEKTFLVVMQNNAELRPSGGFWGSYGVMKVKDGAITSFKTSDSYNLDLQNKGKFSAPDEIKDIVEDEWRFWNANWSPDFKYSVEQGLSFYKEVEPDVHFDAVIGPNVDYLLQTLKISGPVDVPDHNFKVDENNFMQKMIYEPTDPAIYASKKDDPNFIYPTDKKPLLADLAKNIFDVIGKGNNLRSFLLATYNALEDKNLLLYFPQEDLEKTASDLYWAGRVNAQNNFVQVVDANLGSKLDFFIDKKLTVKKIAPCEYEGNLNYVNGYKEDSKLTPFVIYRSLTRIFLPKDSTLIDFSGGQKVSNLNYDPKTDTSYLSTLLVIAPRENVNFTLRWKASGRCKNQDLEVVKQSGSLLTAEISP